MPNVTNISVVIPNYAGKNLLIKHLPAVLAMLDEKDELIIVDDASPDDSVAWIQSFFSLKVTPNANENGRILEGIFKQTSKSLKNGSVITIRVLVHARNQRFAASCNHGVELATFPHILLLNSDVRPHITTKKMLLRHFKDELTFAVGCLEQEPNGVTGGKNRLWFARGIFFHERAKNFTFGETAWASGGSAMFDRQKWLTLGGFDLRFAPAYWEDIDLSFRAQQQGWKVLFDPEAIVYHNHETTNQTAFGKRKIIRLGFRNSANFTWKNGNFLQRILFIIWRPYWFYKEWQLLWQKKQ